MKWHILLVAGLTMPFAVPVCAAENADAALPQIPKVTVAPEIDGKIAPEEYAGAWHGTLTALDGKTPADGTEVYLAYDNARLYAAWRCHDRDVKNIRCAWRTTEERDNAVWQDDCVELLCDPVNSRQAGKYYHIVSNTAGVLMDLAGSDAGWNPDVRVMIAVDKDGWSAEMAIPFAGFGVTAPEPGDHWCLNLCRENPRSKEYSAYGIGAGGFLNVLNFREFVFAPAKGAAYAPVSVVSGGNADGKIELSSHAGEPLAVRATALLADGTPTKNVSTAALPAGKSVSLPVPRGADSGLAIAVTDAGGNPLRTWRKLPPQASKPQSVQSAGAPLYSELFAGPVNGKRRPGGLFWLVGVSAGEQRAFGAQFGEPQTQETYFARLAQYDLWGLMSLFTLEANKFVEVTKRHQNKFFLSPEDRPEDRSIPHFFLDPASRKRYLDNVRTTLTKYPDRFGGVFFGDEKDSWVADDIVAAMAHKNEPGYEFIRDLDNEVREKYGFGKYGIPESAADTDVFRWIAFRHCLNDRMIAAMRETRAVMREIIPDGLMVSDDPIASFDRVYDYGLFDGETVDIMSHQTYPRDNFSDTGVFPKFMADLSTVPEIWACLHVEEYGRSYTPDEVRIKVSEAFRNGATGLHYFLSDTTGRRGGRKYLLHEFNGAPDRAQIEMALAKEAAKMPPLKFPVPEVGIYTPVETLRSYIGMHAHAMRTWVAHTRLERDARTAFIHISESSWKRADRSGLKAIFMPDCKYITENALNQLIDYVQNGGTLVIFDSEAFAFTPEGKAPANREVLLGKLKAVPRKEASSRIYFSRMPVAVASTGQVAFTRLDGCQVIARYGEDSAAPAAAVERSLGKGKVLIFGANPVGEKTASSPDNGKFFRAFVQKLGGKLDCDIWRFEFPKSLIEEIPYPAGRCLTGNAIVWRQFKADFSCNDAAPEASYQLSVVPAMGDKTTEPVPLEEGRLTNRRKAVSAPSLAQGKGTYADWMDNFAKPEPFTVRFDLGKIDEIDRVRLVYLYYLRPVTVRVSKDGKAFSESKFPLTDADNAFDVNDVREKVLKLPAGTEGRYVELQFGAAGKDWKFPDCALTEVEIWSAK